MQIYVRNRGYNRSQKFKGSTPHRALPPTFKPKLFDQEEASSTSEISTRDLCLWTANTALLLSRVFFVLCFLTFIVYSLYQGNRFVSYDGFSKRYVKYVTSYPYQVACLPHAIYLRHELGFWMQCCCFIII